MPPPRPVSRAPLVLLLVLDALFAGAVRRLPSRLLLPPLAPDGPAVAPGFAAVMPTQIVFVQTALQHGAETTLVRVPLDRPGVPATRQRLGTDFALLEPVRGLDAFMPGGARWAWSGRTLLLAAPSRGLGVHRVNIALVGPQGPVLPTRVIDGARPSAGWARDHFEVVYVTPAPPPDAGRVQWAIDVDERGAVSHERILSPAGEAHPPFAWPGGVRTAVQGANPDQLMLPDGTVVDIPREGTTRARPYFVLHADGRAEARFTRTTLVAGSELAGEYTTRTVLGDLTVEAHLGARVPRPRFTVSRGRHRTVFEAEVDARTANLVAAEREGVLHLVDPRGFHVRLRAGDLAPLDPRTSRLAYLAGALGTTLFVLVLGALVAAHALALVLERGVRRGGAAAPIARLSGLTALLLAGGAVLAVWYAA